MVPQCPAQDRAHGRCSGKACLLRELLKRSSLGCQESGAMGSVAPPHGGGGDAGGGVPLGRIPCHSYQFPSDGGASQPGRLVQPKAGHRASPSSVPRVPWSSTGRGSPGTPSPSSRLVSAGVGGWSCSPPPPEAEGAPAGGMGKAWGQSVCSSEQGHRRAVLTRLPPQGAKCKGAPGAIPPSSPHRSPGPRHTKEDWSSLQRSPARWGPNAHQTSLCTPRVFSE